MEAGFGQLAHEALLAARSVMDGVGSIRRAFGRGQSLTCYAVGEFTQFITATRAARTLAEEFPDQQAASFKATANSSLLGMGFRFRLA